MVKGYKGETMTKLSFEFAKIKERKAWQYIDSWDEIDGEVTVYLKKPYILKGLHAAQFSEFTDDFDGDEAKCLEYMYSTILEQVEAISPAAWDSGDA